MAFPPHMIEVIGRIGADPEIVTLSDGTKTAKLRVCAQESLQVVTSQPLLVELFEKHGRKNRLIFLDCEARISRCRHDGAHTDSDTGEINVLAFRKISFSG